MLVVGYADRVWRIHNSWGPRPVETYAETAIEDDDDDKGDDVRATDEWFRMHVFHAVVHDAVVVRPPKRTTHTLPPWDILSTVAQKNM